MKRKVAATTIALLLGSNATVLAATHYVDLNNASPSAPYTSWATAATNIQAAVDAAADGGSVLVTNGTYGLDAEVVVTNTNRIESMNGPAETVVVAVNSNRCFNLGARSFLGGFTITNGYAATDGGGVFCADETTTISNCIFAGNTAGDEGGGMYRGTAYDCGFVGNDSLDTGGGTFNAAAYNCNFIDNTAVNKGGGFGISANAAIPSNCVFVGNTANYGGGTYDASTVIDCVFSNNMAIKSGGAVYQGQTAHNCIFAGNTAIEKSGGAICRVYAYDCFFTNNWADDDGGAIYETGASNCTFIGNHAGLSGGAKSWWNGVMQDCVFINNSAGTRGGAVNDGQLYNCIFYDNHSGDRGGAVSEADLYNCVLYNNTAVNNGGGLRQGSARNSILWSNSAPLGNNHYNATILSCYSADPLFVDAANGDFHLPADSPCIDAGSNGLAMASYDFDGIPRPLDGDTNGTAIVDIGCYEYLIATADSDGDTMPDGWETANGLNAAVDDASGNPDADPFSNRDEYVADTDPLDPGDWFRITALSNRTVHFQSSENRHYTLMQNTNLIDGAWVPGESRMGIGGADSMTGSGNVPANFFKLEVQLP